MRLASGRTRKKRGDLRQLWSTETFSRAGRRTEREGWERGGSRGRGRKGKREREIREKERAGEWELAVGKFLFDADVNWQTFCRSHQVGCHTRLTEGDEPLSDGRLTRRRSGRLTELWEQAAVTHEASGLCYRGRKAQGEFRPREQRIISVHCLIQFNCLSRQGRTRSTNWRCTGGSLRGQQETVFACWN